MTRRTGWIIVAIACFAAVISWQFDRIGYLGGDPFTPMRPAAYQARAGGTVAILWSGDMGFNVGMGPRVAAKLVADGIPVVGVNSLTYFRTTRRPAEATALLEKALGQAYAINPRARILLIGQSYGADMLHVALAHLPVAQRAAIGMVALVVPGATVEYRASPAEIFTFAMTESDALPSARQINWAPLLCIYGQEEAASLCPLLHQSNLHVVSLPGGHALHRDAEAVYHALWTAMQRADLTGRR